MKPSDLAKYIDHTQLKPDATKNDIEKLCKEALEHGFKAVCVNPSFVEYAGECLKGKKPFVVAVIGFPFGASQTATKAFEAKEAISSGAEEIDMVVNIGALKEKNYELVYKDIFSVVNEARPCPIKVIIETCYLDRDEKIIASILAQVAGAEFIKTSTGFGNKGANIDDIKLIRSVVGKTMKIKASGGIKNFEDAIRLIEAGADRIGCSSSVNIVMGK